MLVVKGMTRIPSSVLLSANALVDELDAVGEGAEDEARE
jgi:hypothetical protein